MPQGVRNRMKRCPLEKALSVVLLVAMAEQADAGDASSRALWGNATARTIGTTERWSHKVELADLDLDGRVDLLFANGGDHHTKGAPEINQVFRNRGRGRPFQEVSLRVFGPLKHSTRALRVADLNADGLPDILAAGSYETRSRLFLGKGGWDFLEVTESHLPGSPFSFGDMKLGDVDDDGDLDVGLLTGVRAMRPRTVGP